MNILEKFEAEAIEKNIVTYQNAIMYRGYRIHHRDSAYDKRWSFIHDDYDGAEDAHDHRLGSESTIEECIVAINEQIKDNE